MTILNSDSLKGVEIMTTREKVLAMIDEKKKYLAFLDKQKEKLMESIYEVVSSIDYLESLLGDDDQPAQ